jgi:CHAT domain-containing protein
MQVLARHFPADQGNSQLTGVQATRASVLAAVPEHSWVHLSCHGMQDLDDPSRSGFALWDGTLNVTDLAALPSQLRQLAFLSACQTAAGSRRHLDEAIHLAATMQFLGYRHVIATMWSIADAPAPLIAETFYTLLSDGRMTSPDRAAQALHQAVHHLRHKYAAHPLLWAPYIHFGP